MPQSKDLYVQSIGDMVSNIILGKTICCIDCADEGLKQDLRRYAKNVIDGNSSKTLPRSDVYYILLRDVVYVTYLIENIKPAVFLIVRDSNSVGFEQFQSIQYKQDIFIVPIRKD